VLEGSILKINNLL